MPAPSGKATGAFRTIGELSSETGLAQHILRYWETRFPQLRPLQRAGRRRYYRPEDVALVLRIDRLLNHEGYTIAGVQKLLSAQSPSPSPRPSAPAANGLDSISAVRDNLARALAHDAASAR